MDAQHMPCQVPEEQQDVDAELDALLEVCSACCIAELLPSCYMLADLELKLCAQAGTHSLSTACI